MQNDRFEKDPIHPDYDKFKKLASWMTEGGC